MKNSAVSKPAISHYILAGITSVIVLNIATRWWFKLGGFTATIVTALIVSIGLILFFRFRNSRYMNWYERFTLILGYAGILGGLYIGLFALMMLKGEPDTMGKLLFISHYLCYPIILALGLTVAPRNKIKEQVKTQKIISSATTNSTDLK